MDLGNQVRKIRELFVSLWFVTYNKKRYEAHQTDNPLIICSQLPLGVAYLGVAAGGDMSLLAVRLFDTSKKVVKNMIDLNAIAEDIRLIVEEEERVLSTLPQALVSGRFNTQNRNIKMLLGHMIDSAGNNQQRLVRLQYAPRCGWSMPDANVGMLVFPDYTQDNDLWIALQNYLNYPYAELLMMWKYANLHIARVIEAIDQSKLDNYWIDYQGNRCTLGQMAAGYVDHLRLHVSQIHSLMDVFVSD